MIDNNWITAIAQVGFPICAYLLVYIDLRRLVLANTAALNRLDEHISSSAKK